MGVDCTALQAYRFDEEDRKKKFSRLQGQYSTQLQEASEEIASLKEQASEQRRVIDELEQQQQQQGANAEAEAGASGGFAGQEVGMPAADGDQLRSALVAATEPLSRKIEEYRLRVEELEGQLKASRQKHMELTARMAQMEISASNNLKVEESVGLYKDAIEESRAREQALQEQLDDLRYDRDALNRANEELVAGDLAASSSEIKLMREQLEEAQMLKIQAEDATRKVRNLQKENKDLRWQIAMTSSDESIKVDLPQHLSGAGGKHLPQPKGPLALVVKYRKQIIFVYLLLLHFLVYFALTHHSHNKKVVHHHTTRPGVT